MNFVYDFRGMRWIGRYTDQIGCLLVMREEMATGAIRAFDIIPSYNGGYDVFVDGYYSKCNKENY